MTTEGSEIIEKPLLATAVSQVAKLLNEKSLN